jgi:hypothetical protein
MNNAPTNIVNPVLNNILLRNPADVSNNPVRNTVPIISMNNPANIIKLSFAAIMPNIVRDEDVALLLECDDSAGI